MNGRVLQVASVKSADRASFCLRHLSEGVRIHPKSTRAALTDRLRSAPSVRRKRQIQHLAILGQGSVSVICRRKAQIHHHRQIMLFDRFFCPIRALVEFAASK
jgi:hypothetical protein